MKVSIDREKCVLAGECYFDHPELFCKNEKGEPIVLVEQLAEAENRIHASQATELCPAGAISTFDIATGP